MRTRWWLTIVTALAMTGAAGCAGSGPAAQPGSLTPPVGPTGVDRSALDAWREFPVDRKPRPIVLIGPIPTELGYPTEAAKVAAMAADFQLDTQLPAGAPADVTVVLPDGPAKLPTVTAEQAFNALRKRPAVTGPKPAAPLRITRVELGTARFQTDRGELQLPAWLFHPTDAMGPIAWPALRPEAFWRFGEVHDSSTVDPQGGRVSADGRTLTVVLPVPPAPCPGHPVLRYEPETVSSATAVAVGLRTVDTGAVAPGRRVADCARTLMLETTAYTVTLDAPIGNRPVVDNNGKVYPVTPAGG